MVVCAVRSWAPAMLAALALGGSTCKALRADDEPAAPDAKPSATATAEPVAADKKPAPSPSSILARRYELRTRPEREKWIAQVGGTAASEAAVAAGLDWLARHQAQDGHWGSDCLGAGEHSLCDRASGCTDLVWPNRISQTGLAVLAFQAAGHYAFNKQPYSERVERALGWLLNSQHGGTFGASVMERRRAGLEPNRFLMGEQGIAALALADAYSAALAAGTEPDRRYLEALNRSIHLLFETQHSDGGWGNRRAAGDAEYLLTMQWPIQALLAAADAGLSVPPQMLKRITSFVEQQERLGARIRGGLPAPATPDEPCSASDFAELLIGALPPRSSRPASDGRPQQKLLHAVEYGWSWRGEVGLGGGRYIVFYDGALAMHRAGGDAWRRWNRIARDKLVSLQLRDGCERGSWERDPSDDDLAGRVASTALALLSLEVYYRQQTVDEGGAP